MTKCNILSNLYFNTCVYPSFKEVHGLHYNWCRSPLNRTYYRIIDLKLWFESDLKEGEIKVIKRVSENGKYDFSKHLKIFDY